MQQKRMGSRIGRAQIVDRLDQSAPKHLFPNTVHHGARKKWIFRIANPFGERGARVYFFGPGNLQAAEHFRPKNFLRFWMFDDAGRFRIVGEALDELAFTSAVYGDAFEGRAREGLVAIKYDFDGDGQADTFFGFQKLVTE